MKSILSFAFVVIFITNSFSQSPDKIVIKMKDTIRNLKDCVVKISLSRNDHQSFFFPKEFMINEDGRPVDLIILMEKLEKGKFQYYMCNKSFCSLYALKGDSVILEKYDQLTITDSLDCLMCLEHGTIRLKVEYNMRRIDGVIEPPDNIKAISNWVTFYVVP